MKESNWKSGHVVEALPSTLFRVQLFDGRLVLATICGRMRMNNIRVVPGDRVEVFLSPAGDRGRIEQRHK